MHATLAVTDTGLHDRAELRNWGSMRRRSAVPDGLEAPED